MRYFEPKNIFRYRSKLYLFQHRMGKETGYYHNFWDDWTATKRCQWRANRKLVLANRKCLNLKYLT